MTWKNTDIVSCYLRRELYKGWDCLFLTFGGFKWNKEKKQNAFYSETVRAVSSDYFPRRFKMFLFVWIRHVNRQNFWLDRTDSLNLTEYVCMERNSIALSIKTRCSKCRSWPLNVCFGSYYGYNLWWLLIQRPHDDKEDRRRTETDRRQVGWSLRQDIYHYKNTQVADYKRIMRSFPSRPMLLCINHK